MTRNSHVTFSERRFARDLDELCLNGSADLKLTLAATKDKHDKLENEILQLSLDDKIKIAIRRVIAHNLFLIYTER